MRFVFRIAYPEWNTRRSKLPMRQLALRAWPTGTLPTLPLRRVQWPYHDLSVLFIKSYLLPFVAPGLSPHI